MDVGDVAAKFGGARPSGNGFVAPCRICDYTVSISPGDQVPVIVHCHGGCEPDTVLSAVGLTMADLSNHENPEAENPEADDQVEPQPGPLTLDQLAEAKHLPLDFLNRNGVRQERDGVLFTYRLPDGATAPRHHLRVRLEGHARFRWTGHRNDGPIVPYGLEQLSRARERHELVLVEGESDTLTLRFYAVAEALGIPGVDMVGSTLLAEYLEGIDRLLIVREPDAAGSAFVNKIARRLFQIGWQGTALVLNFREDMKDPAQLHVQTQDADAFKAAWKTMVDGAEVLSTADTRPILVVRPGRLPWVVDRAEEIVIADGGTGLYQRQHIVMRVIMTTAEDEAEPNPKIRRAPGSVILVPTTSAMLQDVFSRLINFRTRKKDAEVPSDCPPRVAKLYLSRKGLHRLPELIGVIEAPIIRPDGTVLISPGYDQATGLLLVSGTNWLPVPESPTREEVEGAVQILIEPLVEFPFVCEADRSVVISGILTALTRRLLPAAPLHAFSAPAQASGKSLLADVIAIIATGRPVPSMPAGEKGEEIRKRITALLLAGDAIVNIDNVIEPLSSDALAMALTQSTYQDRVLGRSEMANLPTNVLFLATGNNLTLTGDLRTRALVSRIVPPVEHPEEREFKIKDLRKYAAEHRPKLVRAALTVLRGYHAAGRPPQDLKPFGRFETWADEIRSAMVWAGFADPCITRGTITADDPERGAAEAVFAIWYRVLGDLDYTLSEIAQNVESAGERSLVKEALLEVAAVRNKPSELDTRRLAAWCRQNTDRILGGLRLTRGRGKVHNKVLWKVVKVGEGHTTSLTSATSSASSTSPLPADQNCTEQDQGKSLESPAATAPDSPNSQPSTDARRSAAHNKPVSRQEISLKLLRLRYHNLGVLLEIDPTTRKLVFATKKPGVDLDSLLEKIKTEKPELWEELQASRSALEEMLLGQLR